MKTLDDIRVTENTGEELIDQGYSLMSSDGELCLPENQRTKQYVNDNGELTSEGARFFAKDVLAHLRGVRDVKIIFSGSGYDVYALSN